MKWNNYKERRTFEEQQERLKVKYKTAGMSDEQIKAMYDFDLSEFNGKRREAEHTFRLDEIDMESATAELDCSSAFRYAWIDEIEDERIFAALKSMPQDYIEILTELIIEGYTHEEIAARHNVVRTSITNKINRIKIFFEKFFCVNVTILPFSSARK